MDLPLPDKTVTATSGAYLFTITELHKTYK